ncbi:D-aminoacylase [Sphingomonas sp. PL-96]|uniref:N-acyl-D-amino-acid deacylase family protein n=1 Tax=Sphingomonas sp. PL-96 TaxID=2887201 RepID=UPI001E2DC638|nr:D-aminoacylase [Sphingomonas sp. PL-96]MCC2977071.1 D-aminoacylase [Sphingomonas sp. PL-96]
MKAALLSSANTIIAGGIVIDGSGTPGNILDVVVRDGVIADIVPAGSATGAERVDATGLTLAPGFIDAHTHDDLVVIEAPEMTPKISQGVTTVVVGNCGISAGAGLMAPGQSPPDPLALLGPADQFRYRRFADWADAVEAAQPSVNVAALVGHTALRVAQLDRLDRPAAKAEVAAMCEQLRDAMAAGALGLSTGLAYRNAAAAPTDEVLALAEVLRESGGVYATHLRDETAGILGALDEAFAIGRRAEQPVVVSHLKCAGASNYGRSHEVLASLERAADGQPVGCDCYPYTASSSTLDLKQVVPETPILITWSESEPEQAGRMLADIAVDWRTDIVSAARRLQPAGAVYHCMADADVERILAHPLTMIGSDGLPVDPLPHPRLWGAFPRVLGHYVRERQLFPLETAVRKMTGLAADRFGLTGRGYIRKGYAADLVLFDAAQIADRATFSDPTRPAAGLRGVWVNGVRTLSEDGTVRARAGRMLRRNSNQQQGIPG